MADGSLDFVYKRLLAMQRDALPPASLSVDGRQPTPQPSNESVQALQLAHLRSRVAFNLLHEFEVHDGQLTPQFDWHADTKPGDGKRRTLN
eukprot:667671-Prymnesium_polylepis.1